MYLLKLNSVIFYVVPAKLDTPIHGTCRHVWEFVTVMSGTDGVQTSNRRECPQPRPICERGGGESWVSSLKRGSLFPVLKISVRHWAGHWNDMKIKAERKSNACWRHKYWVFRLGSSYYSENFSEHHQCRPCGCGAESLNPIGPSCCVSV